MGRCNTPDPQDVEGGVTESRRGAGRRAPEMNAHAARFAAHAHYANCSAAFTVLGTEAARESLHAAWDKRCEAEAAYDAWLDEPDYEWADSRPSRGDREDFHADG
jgi:hypothetical protein